MTDQRTRLLGAVAAGCLLALTACGAPDGAATPADPPPAPAASSGQAHPAGHGTDDDARPVLYAVQSGPLGIVVTDGSGRLMYRSAEDSTDPPVSNCAGSCAATWIPVAAASEGQEPDLLGVDPALVGVVRRDDGMRQLTLAGWPLYRHRDDTGTLETTGQNGADATWFVVTSTGEAVTPQP
ncbi:hypothetical protein [Pseudonocardia oceani]|uniref:Lipoprotein with Yx(FWY)xxD motif n=2 Tax=Pseudonocardia oceani TaxID=2792013 RepID=A0ABS6U2V9_9PSEU|nr:hypothetical protein [Pseudonocardia oceani]MBW0126587.1 hypothetical protein [Pseudonocardia oceani]